MTTLVDARRMRAADAGMWLFIASLVMFYASLYSGYVLLRAGSETWATPWLVAPMRGQLVLLPFAETVWLAGAAAAVGRWRVGHTDSRHTARAMSWWVPLLATVLFTAGWLSAATAMATTARGPATSVAAASWFVLTGCVATGVVGGGLAVGWAAWRHRASVPPAHVVRQLQRYWRLMLGFWLAIVVGMYLV